MSILKSCCCFTNVRSGSIACSVYSLVLSVMTAGIVAYNLHIYELTTAYPKSSTNVDFSHLPGNFSDAFEHHTQNESQLYVPQPVDRRSHHVFQGIFLSGLVVACLLFMTSIFLLLGVVLDKKGLLVPWMTAMAANIALDTGTIIYHTTIVNSLMYIIIEMLIWLLLTVMNIYCLLCVASQYLELKAGRGTREHVRRLSANVMYQPEPQHVHINQGPIIVNGLIHPSLMASCQPAGMAQTSNGLATAPLLMSAPDYNIAAAQPPQYQDITSGVPREERKVLLVTHPPQADRNMNSPPPPYSSP